MTLSFTRQSLAPLAALLAGAMYPLAFAPWHWAALALASVALLWWLIHNATPKRAFWLGFAYGAGQFGVGVSWVFVSMHTYGGTHWLLSGLMTAVFVLFLALFPALTGWLTAKASRWRIDPSQASTSLSPLIFIAVWMAVDGFRGWIFSGFPWLYPGYAAIDTPLAVLASYGGVWLVSLLMLCTALALSLLLIRRFHFSIVALTALGWLALGVLPQTPGVTPTGDKQGVAIVQGNIAQTVKWQPSQRETTRQVYADLTASIKDKTRLVIWSESALTEFYRDAAGWIEEQAAVFEASGGALLTGLPRYQLDESSLRITFYNSIVVAAGGEGIYDKQRLVPFGEYVPFAGLIRGLVPFFDLPMSSFTAGSNHQPNLSVHGVQVAPTICFDVLFPGSVARQARNSNVLLEISDDTWFGRSAAPWQHYQMARMRSIETGRYLLRGTNNGITAIIDHQGHIVSELPQGVRGVLEGSYQPMTGATPFMSWGIWLAPVLSALLFVLGWLFERRKKGEPDA